MNPRWIGPALAAMTLLGCSSVSQPQLSSRAPRHDGSKVVALASQAAQLRAKQLNAQALQLAQSGDVQEALRLWEQALSLDPYAARVHNNRGYALMLLGSLDEARVSLNLALAINPPSPQAGANLAMLARLQRQAELAAVSRDLGIAPANMPKQDQPSEVVEVAQVKEVISDASPQLVVIGPQIYELRDAPVQVRTPPSVSPFGGQEAALAAIKAARLEVSNGVGVRLLAKRTSLKLAEQGVVTQRLTNTAGFAQASTELQFNPSQGAAAQALQAMLPAGAALQPLPRLDHLRLVLGHDLAGRAVLAWLEAPSAMAQTTPADHVIEGSARWALVQDGWQWL